MTVDTNSAAMRSSTGQAEPCPCGSQIPLSRCCGPLLAGDQLASSAEQLMRSRYSAYVKEDQGYLLSTWHPSTRPAQLHPGCTPQPQWQKLSVLATNAGRRQDKEGTVTFIATCTIDGRPDSLYEKSRFVQESGVWYYLDGSTIGRNAPCPCGSGKKFKRCCGKSTQ